MNTSLLSALFLCSKTKVFMKYWHVDILLDHLQQLCSRVVVVQRRE